MRPWEAPVGPIMPLPYRPETTADVVKKLARIGLALLSAVLLALFIISIPVGMRLYTDTAPGQDILARHLEGLYFWFLILLIRVPVSLPVWSLLLGLQVVFVSCFIAAAVQGGGVHKAFARSAEGPLLESLRNFLFAMPFIATATLTGTLGLTWLVNILGLEVAPIGEVPEPLRLLLETSYAAVVEELGTRLVGIGLPLALFAAYKAEEGKGLAFVKALFCPASLNKELKKAVRPLAWILVVATSLVFGFLHLLGWTPGKVLTATAAGLVLGTCFLYYGIHASILVHWYLNYHVQIWAVWIMLTKDAGIALLSGLTLFFEIVVGVLSLIMFFVQAVRLIARRREKAREYRPIMPYYYRPVGW